jgi:hypothetical protein
MFAIFADHASIGSVLMFNTGPQHGEAVSVTVGLMLFATGEAGVRGQFARRLS